MTPFDIRRVLASEEATQEKGFQILREISGYVNNPDAEDLGRELVLRAMERRNCFNGYGPILDRLTRQVGLYPYLNADDLEFRDRVAIELHSIPLANEDLVLHRAQGEVFRRLMSGDSVILSAPTSFGKSRIIDAVIASGRYKNIAIVVPTIALIEETRRRLALYRGNYKIVSQATQKPDAKNILVFTAERLNAYEWLPKVDFFVIDEFYKLGSQGDDAGRAVALNHAFYRLHKTGAQFYLLGPSIKKIPDGLENKFKCFFLSTNFATVASELVQVFDWSDELKRLVQLCRDIQGPTLIFGRSPQRVNDIVRALIEGGVGEPSPEQEAACNWIGAKFHEEWIFRNALRQGIGMHHGRLPRSLAHYAVRQFNSGSIRFLACTSTLIEGVNTKAKNVVILDNVIGRDKYDFFTFNNIRGRSGRMFQHFVGRVFIFHPPPQEELPFVDIPVFTQGSGVPESLLIQLDGDDLSQEAKGRLDHVMEQKLLPVEVIRMNAGLEPDAQLALAEHLATYNRRHAASVAFWTGFPKWDELLWASNMVWKFFGSGRRRSGVSSGQQLAFKVRNLMKARSVRERIFDELKPGRYSAESVDEAVERVFEFDRNWASFELPRMLMALSRIQKAIFEPRFGRAGNYGFFATRVEQLFRSPIASALEEFGVPAQVTETLSQHINLSDEIDVALEQIRKLRIQDFNLSDFERELLEDARTHL